MKYKKLILNKYFFSLFVFIFVISNDCFPQDQYLISSLFTRNYDTQHIKLVLSFDEQAKSVAGIATITIVPLDSNFNKCYVHAIDLDVERIMLNDSKSLIFTNNSRIISIRFDEYYSCTDTLFLTFYYSATPQKGLFFNAPSDKYPEIHYQIFSHSEPIDARCWFPCYDQPDDKLTSELIATVDEDYELLSNGKLVNVIENPIKGTKTFHWQQNKPHTTYLISIVAGEYEIIQDTYENINLHYYTYKDKVSETKFTFSKTPEILKLYERKFAYDYPWAKYSQIIVDSYPARGMEHTSATTFVHNTILDKRTLLDMNSNELIAHELAHQWFGNLVTCRNWAHLWLNEGFATNAEIIYLEEIIGKEAAQYEVIQQQQIYIDMEDYEFRQPIVYSDYIHPEEMFNHISYQKASMVLQMLRGMIGDDDYFEILINYLNQYAFQSVTTKDFIAIAEKTSGQDLEWFFNQWLYQGGYPEFIVDYKWQPDSNMIELNVEQVQLDSSGLVPVFRMPVEIEIVNSHKKWLEKRFINEQKETFKFKSDCKPLMIRFDKHNKILKTIQFIKTQDEAVYQLCKDDDLWGRLEAISQLERNTIDTTESLEALKFALLNDSFWVVRKRAASVMEQFKTTNVKEYYLSGLKDPHPKVRAICVRNLGKLESPDLYPLIRNVALSDSSYWVITEALYALIQIPDSLDLAFLSHFIEMESYNDMIQTAAFEGFRELKSEKSVDITIKFALDKSLPFNRRYGALRLLEEIGIGFTKVEDTLIELLNDQDEAIQKKAIQILGNFQTERALLALKELENKKLSDGVRRRVNYAIKKIQEAL